MTPVHKKFFSLILLCLIVSYCSAQVPIWAVSIGSAAHDDARACAVAPNGNVYVAGLFTGTIDLDPSPAIHYVASNGNTDVFLACYTSGGTYLWGLSVGGPGYDGALDLTIDKDNNAVIAGYFSGHNVNFDPLSSGKFLSDAGVLGPVLEQGGDGFVAKYGPTGVCAWAIDLGGLSVFDIAEAVATDERGNVYVGGDFHFTMDIDPSSATFLLNSLNGTGYIIKYNSAGGLVWGHTFGGAGNSGVDNAVWDIKSDSKGSIYVAGCFEDTSNFSQTPVPGSTLISVAQTDGFLVKYDTSGNYQFVISIVGDGSDQASSVALDSVGNVYITGLTSSSVLTFDPSVNALPTPGQGKDEDMFLAKYTDQGVYKWAELIGGKNDQAGYYLGISKGLLYCTGHFSDTVDFDPSTATAFLASNGANDIFLCKYDLDGNYICGFNVGSAGEEVGRHLAFDSAGYMYNCGMYTGVKTDFAPGPIPMYLSTHGEEDGYLVKYDWLSLPLSPNGYFVADTICKGTPAVLTFIATGGTGPYTIVYTDGTTVDTAYYVHSGQQIPLVIQPAVTTTYKILRILSSGKCDPPGSVDTSATMLVHPLPVVLVSDDTSLCPGISLRLYASGGSTYHWYGAGVDSPYIPDPVVTAGQSTQYKVVVTDTLSCSDTGVVQVNIYTASFAVSTLQQPLCLGDTSQLMASGADTYQWYPDSTLSSDTGSTPLVWPKADATYTVVMTEKQCNRRDTIPVHITVYNKPHVTITEAHDVDCGNKAGMIAVTGAQSYQWYPDNNISDATSATPTVHPMVSTMYYVTGTDANSCTNTDSVYIQAFYDGTGRLFAPTGFTPNGDGKNDCFSIHIPGDVTHFELKIFNRWGQNVFTTFTYGQCWDGTLGGVPQDLGTYCYFYKCTSSSCGQLEGKGDVQLIR